MAPFYSAAAATGVSFPLFIMMAADAQPAEEYRRGESLHASGTAAPAALPRSNLRGAVHPLRGTSSHDRQGAARLAITERTVKAHLTAVFEKLGVRDRLQLSLKVNGVTI